MCPSRVAGDETKACAGGPEGLSEPSTRLILEQISTLLHISRRAAPRTVLDAHCRRRQSRSGVFGCGVVTQGSGYTHQVLDDGQTFAGTSQLEHVTHPRKGHCARAPGPVHSAPHGLPLPTSRIPASWTTRCRPAKIPLRCRCARLFLAPSRRLQVCVHAQEQRRLLGEEVQRERRPGSSGRRRPQATRMARHHRLGVRASNTNPAPLSPVATPSRLTFVIATLRSFVGNPNWPSRARRLHRWRRSGRTIASHRTKTLYMMRYTISYSTRSMPDRGRWCLNLPPSLLSISPPSCEKSGKAVT